MNVRARRCFRLAGATALALVAAYALDLDFPYFAPLFAWLFTARPGRPMGPKALLALVLVVLVALGVGLVLVPLLLHYPATGFLLAGLGLYLSFYLTVNRGKAVLGVFLTLGFTLISAAGLVSLELGHAIVGSLVAGVVIAVAAQWLVYPWFPEEPRPAAAPPAPPGPARSNWIALRGTLITLPVYWVVLANPGAYAPVMMKSVTLAQQGSRVSARDAGVELLGSTLLAGCLAIAFWWVLSIAPNLWVFGWTMFLLGTWMAAKMYGVFPSRYPASFWSATALTLLILLGPAVEDAATGKDVYQAFAVRMGLFVAVTLYAWAALALMEWWRAATSSGLNDGAGPPREAQ
jgi:hypothetical protein